MKLTRPRSSDEDSEAPQSKIQRFIAQQWLPGAQSQGQLGSQSQEWTPAAEPEWTPAPAQEWSPAAGPADLLINFPGESQESFLARRLQAIQAKSQEQNPLSGWVKPAEQVPAGSPCISLARQRAAEILSTIAKTKGVDVVSEVAAMRQKVSEILATKASLGGDATADDGEGQDEGLQEEPPAVLGVPESELVGDFHWFEFPQDERDPGGGAEAEHLPAEALQEQRAALQTLVLALGVDVPQDARMEEALLAEATRFLHAVLGFTGEGAVLDSSRIRAISVAATTFAGHGLTVVPYHLHPRAVEAMLGQWFDHPLLISIFARNAIRAAYDRSQKRYRAQFVCSLGRVLMLEALRNGLQSVRREWKEVLEAFPEIEQLGVLLRHIKRRCWDDARDRSKSRSRSREKKKGDNKPKLPKDAIRFVVKKAGDSDEAILTMHFSRFGKICELTLLRDKKTQKPRGVAFVTLQPQGLWQGVKNTKESMREWVMVEKHVVRGGRELEVTEAETKTPEDEAAKREERVEERRKQRELRGRAQGEQRLVLSSWAKGWRQQIFSVLPREAESPTSWAASPALRRLCRSLWFEVSEHVARCGDDAARDALGLFRSETGWVFVPGVDCLLAVAEGFFGSLVDGVFKSDGVDGPGKPELESHSPDLMTAVDLIKAIRPPAPVTVQQALSGGSSRQQWAAQDDDKSATMCYFFQQGQCTNGSACKFSHGQEQSMPSAPKCTEAKIFVGNLTQETTIEMLHGHFSRYGEITDAVVMTDKGTGKPRGFGFVVFASEASMDAVLKEYMNHQVDGQWLDVKSAAPSYEEQEEKKDDKAGTLCYFFQQGLCTNGSACKFSHSQGKEPSQDAASTMCYFFQQGQCTNGEACKFSHSLDAPREDDKAANMCYFFQQGQCTNGSACKFSHGQDAPRVEDKVADACYFFQQGLCTNGSACKFSHG